MFGEAQLAPPAPEVTPAATVKIFLFFHKKYLIKPKPSQVRIVSTLPLFTAAPLVTTQAFQVRGKHLKIKIQCTPKKHVTTVIRTLQ